MPKDLRNDDDNIDFEDFDKDASDKNIDLDEESDTKEESDSLGISRAKESFPKKNYTNKKSNSRAKLSNQSSQVSSSNDKPDEKEEKEKSAVSEDLILDEHDDDSKFFVVRVAGGQENMIASMLQTRLNTKKIEGIYSVLFLESFKGYVIVEAVDSNIAYEALHGIRHIRGQIRGELPFKDLEGYLVKKPVVTELTVDDTVEIIAGPFKSMKAKITRVDYEKQEATVVLLDSPYQIPVTVDANYLKKSL